MEQTDDKKTIQENQLEEIKNFIKPNPAAIFDLASISGLTPQQIDTLINDDTKKRKYPL